MSHHLLNPYVHGHTALHRWPAWVKLVVAGGFVTTLVLLPLMTWIGTLMMGFLLFLLTMVSRLPGVSLMKKVLWLEPVAVGMALLSLFQPNGVLLFLWLLTKSTLSLWVMVLLSSTTRFTDILNVLKRCYVPSLLLTTLALLVRYLVVIFNEMERMRRARLSRSFLSTRGHFWRTTATVAAQLFVRSSERAERVYSAMCARGWKA